jgi:DNA polymerase III subunit gamma/tau
MAETLYRKYRPQTFADVAEQEHVLRTITKQLATNTVAHAYLFSGPRGVGKTTIARLLAKALNCENRADGSFEPCNTCSACADFVQGRMLSCIEIDAASQTGVDNVRENIIENARFAPSRGKYKVFILDEVHMLSASSFNALLKTLEEPPTHAIFILATTELHKIPATIASRCQRFEFHRVPPGVMMPRLAAIATKEGVEVDEDVLAQIARLSEGCLRDAESLLGQIVALGEKHVTKDVAMLVLPMTNLALVADMVNDIAQGETKSAVDRLNAFVRDGGSVKHLVEEMLEYVRAVMFAAIGDTSNESYDEKTTERIRLAGSVMGAAKARAFVDALLAARVRQSIPALPQIPLEIAILSLETVSVSAVSVPPAKPVSAPIVPVPPPVVPAPIQPAAVRYDFEEAAKPAAIASPQAPSPVMPSSGPAAFPVSELVDKWERCCAHVAERNVALPLILRNAKPVSVDGNVVTVGCAYAFHAEALKEPKSRKLLEDAILDVLQCAVTVVPIHVPQKAESDAVTSFVAELGGSLT